MIDKIFNVRNRFKSEGFWKKREISFVNRTEDASKRKFRFSSGVINSVCDFGFLEIEGCEDFSAFSYKQLFTHSTVVLIENDFRRQEFSEDIDDASDIEVFVFVFVVEFKTNVSRGIAFS